jgi:hypothetical protein
VSGQLHGSAALPPGGGGERVGYPLDRSQSRTDAVKKILDPTGIRTPTPRSSSLQPVAKDLIPSTILFADDQVIVASTEY